MPNPEYEKLREKVARAIAKRKNHYNEQGQLVWTPYRPDAEAAMSTIYEALKEPSAVQDMCEAFCELQHPDIPVEDCMEVALAASPLNGGRDE